MEEQLEKKLLEENSGIGNPPLAQPRAVGPRLVIGGAAIVIIAIVTALFGGPFSRSLRGSILSSEERGRDEIKVKAQAVEVYPGNRIRIEKIDDELVMGKWKIVSHDSKKEKKQFEITEIGFDLAYATENPAFLNGAGYRATIGAGENGDVEVASVVLANTHFDGFCETVPLASPFVLNTEETELQLMVSPVDFSNVAFNPIVCIKGRTSLIAQGHTITIRVPEIIPESPPASQSILFSIDTLVPYAGVGVIPIGSPEGASCAQNAECASRACLGLDNAARGKALMFDGIDDFVIVEKKDNLDIPRDMTIASWVKFSEIEPSYRYIYKRSGNYGAGLSNVANSGKLEFTIVGKELGNARAIFGRVVSVRDYNDDAWHFVAGTYDGASLKLYVDGVLEAETLTPTPVTVFYQIPYSAIGKPANEGSSAQVRRHWKGGIDEVRVYDRALTLEEVTAMFSHAAPAGALLYYSFDSIINGKIADESGNGHAGAVSGAQFPLGQCSAPAAPLVPVIEDDGATLHLSGKTYQAISYSYTVTPHTKISLDYQSDVEGAFQGIGIDRDDNWAPLYFFELYGTGSSGGDQSEHNYADSAPNFKHYTLPLGQMYQGDIRLVTFINSPADGGTAESRFKNVLIYEEALPAESPLIVREDAPMRIARYTFDEPEGSDTAVDASGNGLHGRIFNGAIRVNGVFGSALSFDGIDDYVLITANNLLNMPAGKDFSYSLWLQKSDREASQFIFAKGAGGTRDTGYSLVLHGGATPLAELSKPDEAMRLTISQNAINDTEWHHIVVTHDRDGLLKLYIDGSLSVTGDISSYNVSLENGRDLALGAYSVFNPNSTQSLFKGALDDVQLFTGILTDEAVLQMYREGQDILQTSKSPPAPESVSPPAPEEAPAPAEGQNDENVEAPPPPPVPPAPAEGQNDENNAAPPEE